MRWRRDEDDLQHPSQVALPLKVTFTIEEAVLCSVASQYPSHRAYYASSRLESYPKVFIPTFCRLNGALGHI
jgi:hypothetical protein